MGLRCRGNAAPQTQCLILRVHALSRHQIEVDMRVKSSDRNPIFFERPQLSLTDVCRLYLPVQECDRVIVQFITNLGRWVELEFR
ncbi:hypothetical protein H6H02_20265 [Coleofasciculus sp. FACHB-1120]|nr:hypothetical protein [Coleofasciculus sp. FACHB-1120]